MSAINVIRQNNSVHVLTDAAAYDERGTIIAIAPKVWQMPHLNCLFAVRGPKLAAPLVVDAIGGIHTSYDELRDNIAEDLRRAVAAFEPIFAQCGFGADLDLVIAGISESRGPDSYLIATHRRYGTEPFKVAQMGPLAAAPADPAIQKRLLSVLPAGATADSLDPATDGLRILQVQRDAVVSVGKSAKAMKVVGGFAQLSSVTRDGISTRVLHRWPDCIMGQPVDGGSLWDAAIAEAHEYAA
jgi:hypothetical protein